MAALLNRRGAPVDAEDLRKMCASITHRGPDGAGFARLNGGAVALGHVRLSIIDLATGTQPIFNEDKSVAITYNGEIYEYKRLRQELIEQGHTFRTHSDTEVIVHLYEQYGLDFVHHLNGEFAFVLWDQKNRRLVAARDRCGVKPLYYLRLGDELLLCSEVKGLFALDRVPKRINPDYLTGALVGVFSPSESAFAGISSLKPGHLLIVEENGESREIEFWRPTFAPDAKISHAEAVEGVRREVTKAVERRMVADVPVGAYLSGGVDSSIVCGLMAERTTKLKAFSIAFGGTEFDESSAARQIANKYGAQFESIECGPESMAAELVKTVYHTEQPVANANAISKLLLSRLVREKGYKVCLTGEGADELFGGYPYFKQERFWAMKKAGGEEKREAKKLWRAFKKTETRSEGILWSRFLGWQTGKSHLKYANFYELRALQNDSLVPRVLQPEQIEAAQFKSPSAHFYETFPPASLDEMEPFNASRAVTYNQLFSYIIPVQGDRVDMANSVECRPPFMDPVLIDYASTLPTDYFIDMPRLQEKDILRRAFTSLLPPIVTSVHKHPFLSPNWYRISQTKEGSALVDHHLSAARVRELGIFKPGFVKRLQFYWRWLPKGSALWKIADLLAGLVLTTQILHEVLIEKPVTTPDSFTLREV